jgi:polyphosphate glucokinase
MNVLVVDVGGTSIKMLATGQATPRAFHSGPAFTPEQMVLKVRQIANGWKYDVVSIGYPGPVLDGHPVAESRNLGRGWVGFDYEGAFGCRVKIVNDAAMQALGSYKGGRMFFLGLGTGLGSALIVHGALQPMELGHLPYKRGTYEGYLGLKGLERLGVKKWQQHLFACLSRLMGALQIDDVVLGGGNVHKLKELPPGCRKGHNDNAFRGGFLLWKKAHQRKQRGAR